ncbi:uncharacterized protein LOC141599946 [Silene latifolia]|uniref:uncharacterized protein LOC141599946 n=1 Tax=Silene latifolia TaxID=37657 RepID=UPI003D7724E6
MLGVGRLTPPPLSVIRPTTIYKHHSSYISPFLQHNNHTLFLLLKTSGFCLHAQKAQQNSSLSRIKLEKQDFDDGSEADEDDYDEFDEELDDEIDDDDELMVPFHKMDDWLRKKPKGFGEGKVYDTSIEDKLLEELEKIREAQLANVEKLKNEPIMPEPKKELKELKASEVAPGCVRVRISNLPKKRNIHRDLKSAFEGVNGITNILPVVSGTKKTRDPVCKGFSFVDFKSLEDANRFVQLFSGQNIAFGKTEKRIKCEILKQRIANEGSVHGHDSISESSSTIIEEDRIQVGDIGEHDPQLDSWEDDDFDESNEDFEDGEIVGNIKLLNLVEKSDIESVEARLLKQSFDELPTKPKEKTVRKKKPALKKPDNPTKIKVPGSAKRLKVHEKAKLADVYSRYGVKQEALASKET